MSGAAFDRIQVKLESAGIVGPVEVAAGRQTERVGDVFDHRYTLISPEADAVDPAATVGQPMTVTVTLADGTERRIHGAAAAVDLDHDAYRKLYVITVQFVPRVWRLSQQGHLAYHVNKSVPEAIADTLTRAGFARGVDFDFHLHHDYPVRAFILQYKEDDLTFIRRLAEHWGISLFLEHDAQRDKLVFSDTTQNWGTGVVASIPYSGSGEQRGITRLRQITRQIPAEYEIRDYDYSQAGKAWAVSRPIPGGQGGRIIEYGANFERLAEGELLAQARVEEQVAQANMCSGVAAEPLLSPGCLFTLTDHPQWDGRRFVVIRADAEFRLTAWGQIAEDGPPDYRCDFEILEESYNYRPPRTTPKPWVHGILPAITQPAANSQYAKVDKHGRYQIRLLCADADDEGAVYPFVRMAQPHGGPGYGFHFPLRPNVEVALTFIDGDIDRPIIMAHVPNPATPSVINAGSHTQNGIHTGGGNRIHIEDKAGLQRMKLSSPHMGTVHQLGSPNAPESGSFLGTFGGVTSFSASTTSALSTMTALTSTWWKYISARNTVFSCGSFDTEKMIRVACTLACTAIAVGTTMTAAVQKEKGTDKNAAGKPTTGAKINTAIADIGKTGSGLISVESTYINYGKLTAKIASAGTSWAAAMTENTSADTTCQSTATIIGEVGPVYNWVAAATTISHCAKEFTMATAPQVVMFGKKTALVAAVKDSRVWGTVSAELGSAAKALVSAGVEASMRSMGEVVIGVAPTNKEPPIHSIKLIDGGGIFGKSPELIKLTVGEGAGSAILMTPAAMMLKQGENIIEMSEAGIRIASAAKITIDAPEMIMQGANLNITAITTAKGDVNVTGAVEIIGDVDITGAMEVEGATVDIIAGTTINGTCAILGNATFMGMVEVV